MPKLLPNIVDLIKEQQMNEHVPPACTEKAQIVIAHNVPGSQLIMRYSTVKKALKELEKLNKAWDLCKVRGNGPMLHDIYGDMFDATVDVSTIIAVCYVDIAKRAKFVPYTG